MSLCTDTRGLPQGWTTTSHFDYEIFAQFHFVPSFSQTSRQDLSLNKLHRGEMTMVADVKDKGDNVSRKELECIA